MPAQSLPYNQPGTYYMLVALPKEDPTAVACTFCCMMKFTVKDCDPTTGETDDEGYEDEYVVSLWEAHLVLKITEQLPMGADNQTKSCCFGLQFSLKEFFLTYKNTCSCIKRKHEK
jgi:hypothetical protein